MDKIIYHGSDRIVRSPRFGAGRAFNDFGLGFYCTESADSAREWADCRGSSGFITRYTIDVSGLRVIDLSSPRYCALHWLSVLLGSREFDSPSQSVYRAKEYIRDNFAVDYQGCDCMAGSRADDVCFAAAQVFLCGLIPYGAFSDILSRGGLGRQFVIKSNRAFDRITYSGYEPVTQDGSRQKWAARELAAVKRLQAHAAAAAPAGYAGGLYISQLIEEEVKPYDQRLSRL